MNQIFDYLKKISKSVKTDRVSSIINILQENKINYTLQTDNLAKNIDLSFGNPNGQKLIFMAHHDIANSTLQGANDNTASIAILLDFAVFLKNFTSIYNIHIAFVDNEENLGAIMSNTVEMQDKIKLITHIGSYLYLKKMLATKIKCVINLEMSGIGESIFCAKSSGNVGCDTRLNEFLSNVCSKINIDCKLISISNSDFLSSFICKIPSTVIGALPNEKMVNRNGYLIPQSWQTMHSKQDTIDKINENTLIMMQTFLQKLISDFNLQPF